MENVFFWLAVLGSVVTGIQIVLVILLITVWKKHLEPSEQLVLLMNGWFQYVPWKRIVVWAAFTIVALMV